MERLFHDGYDNRLLCQFPFQRPLPLVRVLAVSLAFHVVLHHVPRRVVNIVHSPRYKRQGERGWRIQQKGLLRLGDGDGGYREP